ncbi:MAG: hypothetical protein OXH77_10255 [Anaerolineaceae bacterium]|nr:hypothetical protein [Anaerolineaceae bacterium]
MSWPEDRVLVAAITRRADLHLTRGEGWYRIPQARMPQGVPAEYLAFFTGARVIGRDQGGIYGYARVKGVELLRRRDLLPDDPLRADDLYYRVQLGDWCWREPPLLNPEGRAFAFIHSTWDRFGRARCLGDLTSRKQGFVARDPSFRRVARRLPRAATLFDSRVRRRGTVLPLLLDDDCPALVPQAH